MTPTDPSSAAPETEPVTITNAMIEAAAEIICTMYAAERSWREYSEMARDSYRKEARIILTAALIASPAPAEPDSHPELPVSIVLDEAMADGWMVGVGVDQIVVQHGHERTVISGKTLLQAMAAARGEETP